MSKRYNGHWTRGLVDIKAAERIGGTVKIIKVIDGKEVVVDQKIVNPTFQAERRTRGGRPRGVVAKGDLTMTTFQMKRRDALLAKSERHFLKKAQGAIDRDSSHE